MWSRFLGVFPFRKLLLVFAILWLLEAFLWGGMYLGYALTLVFATGALAGLLSQGYLFHGSMLSRSVVSQGNS